MQERNWGEGGGVGGFVRCLSGWIGCHDGGGGGKGVWAGGGKEVCSVWPYAASSAGGAAGAP